MGNAPKTQFSTQNHDFHRKLPECTENRVFDRKSRFSPKTPRMHRKPSFRSKIKIFTQNTENAPNIEFSIGNQVFRPKHRKCTENRVFDRKSRFSPKTPRMHRKHPENFRPKTMPELSPIEHPGPGNAKIASLKGTRFAKKS